MRLAFCIIALQSSIAFVFAFPQASFSSSSSLRVKNIDKFVQALPKVELHLHLGGSISPATLWELAKKKSFPFAKPLPDHVKDAKSFAEFLQMRDNGNLPEFLTKFDYMLPQVSGDAAALRRIARDLVETKSREGVIYFEVRYAPQYLRTATNGSSLTLDQVINAVNAGLAEGSTLFNVTAKSIFCCMRVPNGGEYSMPLAQLALRHRANGVVGLDIAGDESKVDAAHPDDRRHVDAFQFAFQNGVHRTIHAGEAGPASNVAAAMEIMRAERIGHGYRVLEDDGVYASLKRRGVHLEECPYSSVKTGAFDVKSRGWQRHPIRRFFQDGASYSINTDDPTVTGHTLVDDYGVVVATDGVGLPLQALVDSVRNAAEAAFVDGEEKKMLKEEVERRLREALVAANEE